MPDLPFQQIDVFSSESFKGNPLAVVIGADDLSDPVTGSLNASIAQWLIGSGRAPGSYVASQGTALGRAGRVHVDQIGNDIWIGGATKTNIKGIVSF